MTATSIPGSYLPSTEVRFADKGAHFFMYGVLALLTARAMHDPPRTPSWRLIVIAVLMVSAVGAFDEWHQRYIEGRTAETLDWMADTTGGLIGAAVWLAAGRAKVSRTA